MLDILVENIVETPELIYGYTTTPYKVFETLEIIMEPEAVTKLLLMAAKANDLGGLHLIRCYQQYIVLIHVDIIDGFNGSICFVDCKNHFDIRIQNYPGFTHYKWNYKEGLLFRQCCIKIGLDTNIQKAKMLKFNTPIIDYQKLSKYS